MADAVPPSTRTKMIAGAARLLAERGLDGTSFAELIEATGAPRGSIYHHFPGGKDELLVEAVRSVAEAMVARLDREIESGPVPTVTVFIAMWRKLLIRSDLSAGCAVAAASTGDAARHTGLHDAARSAFASWRRVLSDALGSGGVEPSRADALAATLIAAMEGAVLMARAEGNIEPFDTVAGEVEALVARELA